MHKKFNIRSRLRSFRHAFRGIFYMLRTQHNAWIHAVIALAVMVLGIVYHISPTEWMLVVLCIGMVFGAEAFNTALESMTDLLMPEQHKKAGLSKDLAAGAVLISAIAAAVIGLLIFVPKIFML
ncbi:MAG: diacylglycerol kinase family protein [Bacteroidales bacterium]|nr:diacylglycerol kinase family protein [Bacteroidales bacterium]MCF8343732.1 diacylglycerol kinase family protein [Bacteroidales bacterium]MCF8349650.1 diacylglycerol kinase family protein [Bacteroidales bacterium]MCF8374896.1 diacylglycerol kinase family protein [Bacteroidales bacterium]MCF8400125.1 diacylglycerol kinase family protein [Bacteroidales bacterium]